MLGLGLGLTSPAVLGGGPAGPVAWTPLNLGASLKAWWNADDTANGLVATWTDRVTSLAITALTGVEPTSAATSFNSAYRGLTFDGTSDCLVTTNLAALPLAGTGGEMWSTADMTASGATGTAMILFRYGGQAAGSMRGLERFAVSTVNRYRITDGTAFVTDTVTNISGPHILAGMWEGTTQSARLDGAPTTPASTTIVALNTTTGRLRIGSSSALTATLWWTGRVRQALITTTLTAAEREKLEGWLAWDGGLASLLPGGHPYKSAPP